MASRSQGPFHLEVEPPNRLALGSADDSNEARQNFLDRERATRDFLSFLPFRKKKVSPLTRRTLTQEPPAEHLPLPSPPQDGRFPADWQVVSFAAVTDDQVSEIQLLDKHTNTSNKATLHRWAYVYENQRGTTLLFRRYRFSRNALFAFDPPPYTMVQSFTSNEAKKQPLLRLDEYPLPDGSWCWLSAEWMIDMRDGNVQHDGFEYNWSFNGKKWRATAGRFRSGAFVRRRRWARLMVRPAPQSDEYNTRAEDTRREPVDWDSVWKGEEEDWSRCHSAIRSQEGDGRKLELWEFWLGHRAAEKSIVGRKQWTEDSGFLPSETARDAHLENKQVAKDPDSQRQAISNVLREHGVEILSSFIYPSSRTRFLHLLSTSKLIPELPSGQVANSLQFWNRIQDFSRETDNDEILM